MTQRPPRAVHHTRWTLVAAARSGGAAPAAELAQRYWYAAYAFLRRSGVAATDAHRLAREFFARLTGERLQALDARSTRRFREFVLAELHSLVDRRASGLPAGVATASASPLTPEVLEQRYAADCAACASADEAFECALSQSIATASIERLRGEVEAAGRGALFAQLRPFLSSEPNAEQQAAISHALGVRPMVVILGLRSLRHRLRELVADELAGQAG